MSLPGCYWCKGSIASHQNSLVDLFDAGAHTRSSPTYIAIQPCFDLDADFGLLCWGHFGAENDEPDSCKHLLWSKRAINLMSGGFYYHIFFRFYKS